MKVDKRHPLDNLTILVTRPEGQANNLCALIESCGANALRFPTIKIEGPGDISRPKELIRSIKKYDIAIFISTNAVEWGMKLFVPYIEPDKKTVFIAIGATTAQALKKHLAHFEIHTPEQANSESVLEMKLTKNIKGRNIIIFRGEGGRELLADKLMARGAIIDYAEVYKRSKPDTNLANFITENGIKKIDMVICTSNEGLKNLVEMTPAEKRGWLLDLELTVLSARMLSVARELGFKKEPVIADRPDDEGILETIIKSTQQRNNTTGR